VGTEFARTSELASSYLDEHELAFPLFRPNPVGHHFISMLLHAVNVVLLFLRLMWATGRSGPSLFVAALFALHPINVESVAWIAESKNVLCTLFFFLILWAYGWYARKPDWKQYLAVAAPFVADWLRSPWSSRFHSFCCRSTIGPGRVCAERTRQQNKQTLPFRGHGSPSRKCRCSSFLLPVHGSRCRLSKPAEPSGRPLKFLLVHAARPLSMHMQCSFGR
jgi:hypothetical protein